MQLFTAVLSVMYDVIIFVSVGGAQGSHPKSDPGVVKAPGGPPEPAQFPEGPGY